MCISFYLFKKVRLKWEQWGDFQYVLWPLGNLTRSVRNRYYEPFVINNLMEKDMKSLFKICVIALAIVLGNALTVLCSSCDKGEALLGHAFKKAPDEMTLEYLNSALDLCPEKYTIYKNAARYYKDWSEKEVNAEKQGEYRSRALEYYSKAIESGPLEIDRISEELSMMQGSRKFNKIAFRALRPSQPGAVNTGLDIHINFKRNSSHLTDDVSILNELGEVMQENESVRISLEGHTDKTGSLEYNNELSVSRASAVKAYMVKKYNIDPSRMLVTGYGYKYLMDKKNPYGPLNRRVEVIKLSD